MAIGTVVFSCGGQLFAGAKKQAYVPVAPIVDTKKKKSAAPDTGSGTQEAQKEKARL